MQPHRKSVPAVEVDEVTYLRIENRKLRIASATLERKLAEVQSKVTHLEAPSPRPKTKLSVIETWSTASSANPPSPGPGQKRLIPVEEVDESTTSNASSSSRAVHHVEEVRENEELEAPPTAAEPKKELTMRTPLLGPEVVDITPVEEEVCPPNIYTVALRVGLMAQAAYAVPTGSQLWTDVEKEVKEFDAMMQKLRADRARAQMQGKSWTPPALPTFNVAQMCNTYLRNTAKLRHKLFDYLDVLSNALSEEWDVLACTELDEDDLHSMALVIDEYRDRQVASEFGLPTTDEIDFFKWDGLSPFPTPQQSPFTGSIPAASPPLPLSRLSSSVSSLPSTKAWHDRYRPVLPPRPRRRIGKHGWHWSGLRNLWAAHITMRVATGYLAPSRERPGLEGLAMLVTAGEGIERKRRTRRIDEAVARKGATPKVFPGWFLAADRRNPHRVVIAVAGTQNVDDVYRDAMFTPVPITHCKAPSAVKCHEGFYHAATRIYKAIHPALEAHRATVGPLHVAFTGHSLGGAVATLLATFVTSSYPGRPVDVFTFGSPKVFHTTHPDLLARLLEGVNVHQFVNGSDIVPRSLGSAKIAKAAGVLQRLGLESTQFLTPKAVPAMAGYRAIVSNVHLLGNVRQVPANPAVKSFFAPKKDAADVEVVTTPAEIDKALCFSLKAHLRPTGLLHHRMCNYLYKLVLLHNQAAGTTVELKFGEYPFGAKERPVPVKTDTIDDLEFYAEDCDNPLYQEALAQKRVLDADPAELYPNLAPLLTLMAAKGGCYPMLQACEDVAVDCARQLRGEAEAALAELPPRTVDYTEEEEETEREAQLYGLQDEPEVASAGRLRGLNTLLRLAAAERTASSRSGYKWDGLLLVHRTARIAAPVSITARMEPYPVVHLNTLFRCLEEEQARYGVDAMVATMIHTVTLWAVTFAQCRSGLHTFLPEAAVLAAQTQRVHHRAKAALTLQCWVRQWQARRAVDFLRAQRFVLQRAAEEDESHALFDKAQEIYKRDAIRKAASHTLGRWARRKMAEKRVARQRTVCSIERYHHDRLEQQAFAAKQHEAAVVLQRSVKLFVARCRREALRAAWEAFLSAAEDEERREHERAERAASLLAYAARRRLGLCPERRRWLELCEERRLLLRAMATEGNLIAHDEAAERRALTRECRVAHQPHSPRRRSTPATPRCCTTPENPTDTFLEVTLLENDERSGRRAIASLERALSAAWLTCGRVSKTQTAAVREWVEGMMQAARPEQEARLAEAYEAHKRRSQMLMVEIRTTIFEKGGTMLSTEEIERDLEEAWKEEKRKMERDWETRQLRLLRSNSFKGPEAAMVLVLPKHHPPPDAFLTEYLWLCVELCTARDRTAAEEQEEHAALTSNLHAAIEALTPWYRDWTIGKMSAMRYTSRVSAKTRRELARQHKQDIDTERRIADSPTADPETVEVFGNLPVLPPLLATPSEGTLTPENTSLRSAAPVFAPAMTRLERKEKEQAAIDYSSKHLTSADVGRLCRSVECSTALTSLDLGGNLLEDLAVEHIASVLRRQGLPNLARLLLPDSHLTTPAAQQLLEAVGQHPSLKVLDISRSIRTHAPLDLSPLATGRCVLTHLIVDGNSLCDKAAATATKLIESDSILLLSLMDNAITDRGARVIRNAVNAKTRAFRLFLGGNLISPVVLGEISAHLQLLGQWVSSSPLRRKEFRKATTLRALYPHSEGFEWMNDFSVERPRSAHLFTAAL
eukprot:Sspe_Gene.31927::Locus_15684_Transcript_1_1_Confidence_1.000_Length_5304::g.31927::m.31927